MLTKTFWVKALERAGKTVAQSALATLAIGATGILDVNWAGVGSVAALAGVVSLLTSVASTGVSDSSSPSLVKE